MYRDRYFKSEKPLKEETEFIDFVLVSYDPKDPCRDDREVIRQSFLCSQENKYKPIILSDD